MQSELEKVLFSPYEIDQMVIDLAHNISTNYKDSENLVLVGVLKGSYMFLADLSRKLSIPHTVDFISVSSYQDTESTGTVKINSDLKNSITGKDVIIVEDIIDSGLTLQNLVKVFQTREPRSISLCCAFSKPSMRKVDIKVEHIGFVIDPPMFIVGYGLDYNEMFRNLSCVGIPTAEAIEKYKTK